MASRWTVVKTARPPGDQTKDTVPLTEAESLAQLRDLLGEPAAANPAQDEGVELHSATRLLLELGKPKSVPDSEYRDTVRQLHHTLRTQRSALYEYKRTNADAVQALLGTPGYEHVDRIAMQQQVIQLAAEKAMKAGTLVVKPNSGIRYVADERGEVSIDRVLDGVVHDDHRRPKKQGKARDAAAQERLIQSTVIAMSEQRGGILGDASWGILKELGVTNSDDEDEGTPEARLPTNATMETVPVDGVGSSSSLFAPDEVEWTVAELTDDFMVTSLSTADTRALEEARKKREAARANPSMQVAIKSAAAVKPTAAKPQSSAAVSSNLNTTNAPSSSSSPAVEPATPNVAASVAGKPPKSSATAGSAVSAAKQARTAPKHNAAKPSAKTSAPAPAKDPNATTSKPPTPAQEAPTTISSGTPAPTVQVSDPQLVRGPDGEELGLGIEVRLPYYDHVTLTAFHPRHAALLRREDDMYSTVREAADRLAACMDDDCGATTSDAWESVLHDTILRDYGICRTVRVWQPLNITTHLMVSDAPTPPTTPRRGVPTLPSPNREYDAAVVVEIPVAVEEPAADEVDEMDALQALLDASAQAGEGQHSVELIVEHSNATLESTTTAGTPQVAPATPPSAAAVSRRESMSTSVHLSTAKTTPGDVPLGDLEVKKSSSRNLSGDAKKESFTTAPRPVQQQQQQPVVRVITVKSTKSAKANQGPTAASEAVVGFTTNTLPDTAVAEAAQAQRESTERAMAVFSATHMTKTLRRLAAMDMAAREAARVPPPIDWTNVSAITAPLAGSIHSWLYDERRESPPPSSYSIMTQSREKRLLRMLPQQLSRLLAVLTTAPGVGLILPIKRLHQGSSPLVPTPAEQATELRVRTKRALLKPGEYMPPVASMRPVSTSQGGVRAREDGSRSVFVTMAHPRTPTPSTGSRLRGLLSPPATVDPRSDLSVVAPDGLPQRPASRMSTVALARQLGVNSVLDAQRAIVQSLREAEWDALRASSGSAPP